MKNNCKVQKIEKIIKLHLILS